MVVVNPTDIDPVLEGQQQLEQSIKGPDNRDLTEIYNNLGGGGGQWIRAWYVDMENGDDTNTGKSPDQAFKTIQKGLDSAKTGDVVFVWGGSLVSPVSETDITFKSDGVTLKFMGAAIDVSGMANYFISTNGHGNCLISGVVGIFADGITGTVFIVDGVGNLLFPDDHDKAFISVRSSPGNGTAIVIQDTISLLTIGTRIRHMDISHQAVGIEIKSPTVVVSRTEIEYCTFDTLSNNGIIINSGVEKTTWHRCIFKEIVASGGQNFIDNGTETIHQFNYYDDDTPGPEKEYSWDGIYLKNPVYDTIQYYKVDYIKTNSDRLNNEMLKLQATVEGTNTEISKVKNLDDEIYQSVTGNFYSSDVQIIEIPIPYNRTRINTISVWVGNIEDYSTLTFKMGPFYSGVQEGIYEYTVTKEPGIDYISLIDSPIVLNSGQFTRIRIYMRSDNPADDGKSINIWVG